MKKNFAFIALTFIFFFSHKLIHAQLEIQPAFPNLSFQQPVDIQNAGDGSNRLFVVEQRGVILVFQNNQNTSTKKIFLDLSDKVKSGGELGLLGLAFHPDYKNNGYFFVNYTTDKPLRSVVSRFKVTPNDPDKADRNSELILFKVNQPYSNHNGGQTSFGPDGYLYISFGDGGSAGDPQNNAQNNTTLLGKILRIDVNKKESSRNYAIPPDNPFKGNRAGFREEIYAFGLRNVWRFSFDFQTKKLWAADVGQNLWEEINLIENGGNYGWRCYEGFHTYNTSRCDALNYIKPIWEYGHNEDGGYSITGGFVYRGKNVPELSGKYIYADFISGNIWALELKESNVKNIVLFKAAHSVSTFGIDENKELYFTNYSSGRIYKFKNNTIGH
ncbi:MAG: PQQ-dependent sugar dehydrogenase [Bacteroidota bacterium]